MTTLLGTAAWFEAVGRVCADVTAVKVVQGVNTGENGTTRIVRPLMDDLASTPAIVLVPGPWTVIAGSAARLTFTVDGAIYVPRDRPGDRLVELLEIYDALFDAFAARGKAYAAEPTLQSVLITRGTGLERAEWPPDSNAWYLSWPFELEVKVNVSAVYQPQ